MEFEPKSIETQIHCLARLTDAPRSFVSQVRQLFTRKGISLEDDATPYLHALEEAFIREESIRAGSTADETRQDLPGNGSDQLARTYLHELDRLKRVQSELRTQRRFSSVTRFTHDALSASVLPSRALVTRQQREDMPMVPGPDELQ